MNSAAAFLARSFNISASQNNIFIHSEDIFLSYNPTKDTPESQENNVGFHFIKVDSIIPSKCCRKETKIKPKHIIPPYAFG